MSSDEMNAPPPGEKYPHVAPPGSRRRRLLVSALVVVPFVALEVVAATYPRGSMDEVGGRVLLTVPVSWSGHDTATYVTVISLVALVVWSCIPDLRWRPYVAAPLVGLVLVCGSSFTFGLTHRFRAPSISMDVQGRGPDGARYRLGWDGEDYVLLLRDVSTDGDVWTAEVLAADGDGAFLFPSVATVIRPTGRRAAAVHVAADGFVYCVAESGQLYVGWDPRGPHDPEPRSPYYLALPIRSAVAHEEVSPFVLLTANDVGDDTDVAAVSATIADALRSRAVGDEYAIPWAPSEAVLLDALDSPNPWIVETARRFIRAGGEKLYPEAMKRL